MFQAAWYQSILGTMEATIDKKNERTKNILYSSNAKVEEMIPISHFLNSFGKLRFVNSVHILLWFRVYSGLLVNEIKFSLLSNVVKLQI